jgi:raffinose/stachyose/melibiose transport system substrate-binding protein
MNHRDNWTTQIFMTCGYSIALKEGAPDTYNDIMAHKIGFSDVPEFKQVLGQFKRLIDEGLVNKDHLSAGYDDGLAAVASGKAAMVYNGEWAISSLESEGKTIGCFPIPWNDNAYMSTGAYVQGFFVPRDAAESEGALRFLELYSSPEYMDIYYAENPGFPAFDGVNGGEVNPQLSAMVNDYMSREKTVYQMNDYMAPLVPLWGELWGAYVEFAAGNMNSDEVLSFWDKTVANHMSTIGQPGW